MPLVYSSLTDRALCDAATAEIDFELLTYSARDVNSDLDDKRAERLQSSATAQLATVEARLASAEAILALPSLTADEREKKENELSSLKIQRKKLQKRLLQVSGLAEFLTDVDIAQNDQQVALLNDIKAGIAQHRTTLSA
ncbi:hypothetical protein [Hymenobacter metallicola]|uniref:Uncharacterized protein n=1 Tax=Hymenobacter metallicola TaxID=2563114 RepID=A0A4Z0QE47_9BACT|nr:hypothetical protein [Hymenobacter metallicola]TGE27453.1 hypothetical protein E5K02_13830 [Hymenobacter metallicola]